MIGTEVIPDDRELIAGRLRWWSDEGGCELVLTTGGTGFSPSDVTPEATRDVIDREARGSPRRCVSPPASTPPVDGLARRRREPAAAP